MDNSIGFIAGWVFFFQSFAYSQDMNIFKSASIFVVDDDSVRNSLASFLEDYDFQV